MTLTAVVGTPHPALRGAALRYEGFEDRRGTPTTFRELPCTFAPVIIDLDAGWTIVYGGAEAQWLRSFVAGVTDGVVVVGHGGTARCLQIDLTPLGARRLLGVPMSELANATVPVEAVLGAFGSDLVERIGNASTWRERFALIDEALRARLADAPPVDAAIAWSLRRITAAGGNLSIGVLADRPRLESSHAHRAVSRRRRPASEDRRPHRAVRGIAGNGDAPTGRRLGRYGSRLRVLRSGSPGPRGTRSGGRHADGAARRGGQFRPRRGGTARLASPP